MQAEVDHISSNISLALRNRNKSVSTLYLSPGVFPCLFRAKFPGDFLQDPAARHSSSNSWHPVENWHSDENRARGYFRAWRLESVVLGCTSLLAGSVVLGELQKVQSLGLLLK